MINRITAMSDALLTLVVPQVRAEAQSCGACQCRQRVGPGYCVRYGRRCCAPGGSPCWWQDC